MSILEDVAVGVLFNATPLFTIHPTTDDVPGIFYLRVPFGDKFLHAVVERSDSYGVVLQHHEWNGDVVPDTEPLRELYFDWMDK
jgi:hypothetical protein